MQKAIKVQLLKNAPGAIFSCIFTLLERNSVHDFEKYNIPDRICFGGGLIFRTYAYCNNKEAVVGCAIQVICVVLAGKCIGEPG